MQMRGSRVDDIQIPQNVDSTIHPEICSLRGVYLYSHTINPR